MRRPRRCSLFSCLFQAIQRPIAVPRPRHARLAAALALVASLAALSARSAEPPPAELYPTIAYDPRSGLSDAWVEAALLHDEHLYAGTRSGLHRFDGLHWESLIEADTIRWLGSSGSAVWAAGGRGLWTSPEGRVFRLLDGSPRGLRCSELLTSFDATIRCVEAGELGGARFEIWI